MEKPQHPKPLIVDIKRNALDDGPGIRTTVFFKGCPLSCVWCQNPEAISPYVEIMFSPGDCIACRTCEQVCPEGAISFGVGPIPIDRARCRHCGTCVDNCLGMGMRRVGKYYSPMELVEIVSQDIPFYRNSGGGVTLSGGEATLYPRYLEPFLEEAKSRGIHINLETCGYYHEPEFRRAILPYLDLIYFDIKIFDSHLHQQYTGHSNEIILNNLRTLVEYGQVRVLPRVPLIPEITDTAENLEAIAGFLKGIGVKKAALLPYNPMWVTKADNLSKETVYRHDRWMTPEEKSRCTHYFSEFLLEKF